MELQKEPESVGYTISLTAAENDLLRRAVFYAITHAAEAGNRQLDSQSVLLRMARTMIGKPLASAYKLRNPDSSGELARFLAQATSSDPKEEDIIKQLAQGFTDISQMLHTDIENEIGSTPVPNDPEGLDDNT